MFPAIFYYQLLTATRVASHNTVTFSEKYPKWKEIYHLKPGLLENIFPVRQMAWIFHPVLKNKIKIVLSCIANSYNKKQRAGSQKNEFGTLIAI